MARWVGLSGVVWTIVPASPARVTWLQTAGFAADLSPGLLAGAFGDAGQQQRQPAQQGVGADAVLQPVEHGPEQQVGLQVAEAALGLQQVLGAEGDVLGGQLGVGGGQQVLAVQPLLGLDLGAVDDQPPVRPLAQPGGRGWGGRAGRTRRADARPRPCRVPWR